MALDIDTLVNAAVLDEFAVEVSYDPRVASPGAPAFAARGIFDADHEMVLTQVANSEYDAAGHSTTGPVLGVRPSELGLAPKQGDRLTITSGPHAGKVYAVWDIQPDGDGWLDLILKLRV
ncbi:MAG: hypothetical protein AB7K67_00895 [Hyphomicrobiaceae bacterium]